MRDRAFLGTSKLCLSQLRPNLVSVPQWQIQVTKEILHPTAAERNLLSNLQGPAWRMRFWAAASYNQRQPPTTTKLSVVLFATIEPFAGDDVLLESELVAPPARFGC